MDDLPDSLIDQVSMMESILIARARGAAAGQEHAYGHLRREFMADDEIKPLLPSFVRSCRDLDAFWSFIQPCRFFCAEGAVCGPEKESCAVWEVCLV